MRISVTFLNGWNTFEDEDQKRHENRKKWMMSCLVHRSFFLSFFSLFLVFFHHLLPKADSVGYHDVGVKGVTVDMWFKSILIRLLKNFANWVLKNSLFLI